MKSRFRLTHWVACYWLFLGCLFGQGLDVMFVLETSPGTEQAIGLIRTRDLKEGDRAGVIGFTNAARVLQPLTQDREKIATALQRAGTRITIGLGGGPGVAMNSTADVSGAIQQACRELEQDSAPDSKHAVLVFFTSEDPGLSARLGSLKEALQAARGRLFAVVIQRVAGPEFPRAPRAQTYPFPAMTAKLLSEVARESGGRIYQRAWDLKEILAEARK